MQYIEGLRRNYWRAGHARIMQELCRKLSLDPDFFARKIRRYKQTRQ
jgi:hypothetical protein